MEYNVNKKRKRFFSKLFRKKKIAFIFVIFLCVFLLIFLYLSFVVNPVILHATEAKVKSLTQKALSSAVYTVISNNDYYDDIITYTYDNNGKIAMITANTLEANMLSRQISSMAQGSVETMTNEGIDVHLGAFSGLMILANSGPFISMKLTPIGTISTSFRSEFVSAGINQTNHRIYIEIFGSVSVILPTASPQIEVSTEVLIAECVVIGEIPSTYLQSSYLDEMLNLVPV